MLALSISKELLKTETDVVLLGAYIPPADSPYYKDTDIYNGISMLEDCIMDFLSSHGDCPFIVFGDLNARIGNESVNVSINNNFDDTLYVYDIFHNKHDDDNFEYHFARVSADSVTNSFGKYLLQVCEEFGLCIVNGISEKSFSGDYTYVSNTGSSVIDYFLVSHKLVKQCMSLSVTRMVESKHMPVELTFAVENSDIAFNLHTKKCSYKRYVWDEEKTLDFYIALHSDKVKTCFEEAMSLVHIDIDLALERFNEGLKSAGACMTRKIKVGSHQQSRLWFDLECRESRKALRGKLDKFHKSHTDADRALYVQKRREYKELLRQKKLEKKESTVNALKENISNQKAFWSTMKKIQQKRPVKNSIDIGLWHSHFKDVFNHFFLTALKMSQLNVLGILMKLALKMIPG